MRIKGWLGSAAAISYKRANRNMDTEPAFRFVTAALNINYLAPTPMGVELELIGTFSEVKDKKVIVEISLSAQGKVCVQGQVIAVKMPDTMG
jgi:acyl-CoA thioesterase FadM